MNHSADTFLTIPSFLFVSCFFFLFLISPPYFSISLMAFWKSIDTWLHSFSCRRTQHERVSQRKWEVVGPSFEVVCCFSQHTRGSYVGSFPVLQSYVSVSLCHNAGDATCVIFWLKWVGDKPQPLQVCPLAFAGCCCVHDSIRFCVKIVWRFCLRNFYGNKTTTDPRVRLPLEIKVKVGEASVMMREKQHYKPVISSLDQFSTKNVWIFRQKLFWKSDLSWHNQFIFAVSE